MKKNIKNIFGGNKLLMDEPEVKELIEYTQFLEGEVFESNLSVDKEHIYKTIISDILISCEEYENSKVLKERYPDLYKEIDSDTLIQNLKTYIENSIKKNYISL